VIVIPKIRLSPIPYLDERIIEVMENNMLVVGPHIKIFEEGLADCFGFNFANTTSNGFSALFLALKSLNLQKAKVIVPAVSTCQSITNAVLANGFEVVFCDIDPYHLSLSEKALDFLSMTESFNAIIAPSHFGIPAPITIFKKYGVPVIEDACQAFFTRTTIKSPADVMVLSFYPTKQFNCIDGGVVLHNSSEKAHIIEDIRYYDNQKSYDGKARFNFRLPNLNAALGCLKLDQVETERDRLLELRNLYIKGINQKKLILPTQKDVGVIPWRFLIKSNEPNLYENLRLTGVQSDREMTYLGNSLSLKTRFWFDDYQSIPFYSSLQNEEQMFIIFEINKLAL